MGFTSLKKGSGIGGGSGGESNPASTSAFGEVISVENTPVFQLDGLYGLQEDLFYESFDNGGVTEIDSNGLMTARTSTLADSFATLTSLRSIRYRPGQGSMARFTAMFPQSGVAGYQQLAGYLNQSDALAIGFDGENFGVLRRYNSYGHTAKFDITTAAGNGGETLTITLDGTAYEIDVTDADNDTEFSAAEIAEEFNANHTTAPFLADVIDDSVYFVFYNGHPVPMTGAFSIVSDGVLAATYTALQNGVTPDETWTHQGSFNIDTLDGNGPSGMTIDPTKLNVYQIDFRWLGVGRARFSVEDQATGTLIPFHEILFSNQNTQVHLANPSMRVGYRVISLSASGTEVSVKGASILGAIQGKIIQNVIPTAVVSDSASLTQNTTHHVLSLKNNLINESGTLNKLNQREILLQNITAGCTASSSTPVELFIYKRAIPSDTLTFQTANTNGAVTCSKTEATLTNGHLTAAFTITTGATANIDLSQYRIVLPPGEQISVALRSTSNIQKSSVSLVYNVE